MTTEAPFPNTRALLDALNNRVPIPKQKASLEMIQSILDELKDAPLTQKQRIERLAVIGNLSSEILLRELRESRES